MALMTPEVACSFQPLAKFCHLRGTGLAEIEA